MQFVYKPEGADPKRWDFDPDRLMNAEAEALERLTKMTYAQWTEAVQSGSVLALHGLLYVMLKRSIPTLKWDEVQFSMSEVDFELDDDETANLITALEAMESTGEIGRAEQATLDSLRAQAADRQPDGAAAGEEADEAPKA